MVGTARFISPQPSPLYSLTISAEIFEGDIDDRIKVLDDWLMCPVVTAGNDLAALPGNEDLIHVDEDGTYMPFEGISQEEVTSVYTAITGTDCNGDIDPCPPTNSVVCNQMRNRSFRTRRMNNQSLRTKKGYA